MKKVVEKCQNEYPGIVIKGLQHGYYKREKEKEVVAKIRSANPDLLFVAFGSPRKEMFLYKYRDVLNAKGGISVGGSYEVFVGDKKRGPAWRQNLGLEWLTRLMQEPRRLWKRYMVTNTMFIFYLLKFRLNRK